MEMKNTTSGSLLGFGLSIEPREYLGLGQPQEHQPGLGYSELAPIGNRRRLNLAQTRHLRRSSECVDHIVWVQVCIHAPILGAPNHEVKASLTSAVLGFPL